jgi:hypothetical protein
MAAIQNWDVVSGDTFRKTPQLVIDATGIPVNITGATFSGMVGTQTLACSIVDAVNGQFSFELSPTQTTLLKPTNVKTTNAYSVKKTDADGTVTTLLMGNVVVI